MSGWSYIVVTPARDEVRFIGDLAESLLAQSVPFDGWIVVDDGSTDGTRDVVRGYADKDARVTLVERTDRRERLAGCGDLEAALIGLGTLPDVFKYDYVAKIDADLVLPHDYFERLFGEFERDGRLGILGGQCLVPSKGGLVLDKVPEDHVNGATKVYRREALRQIWPLEAVWGWDTVDECRAQMKGWKTRSVMDPAVLHQKPMSGGSGGLMRGNFLVGRICHYLGYRADYMLLRILRHLLIRPVVIGSLAMATGYALATLRRESVYPDPEFTSYLRKQQADRMKGLLSAAKAGGERAR